eukprot:353687-Chlamydomonas_euryale.AAC.3
MSKCERLGCQGKVVRLTQARLGVWLGRGECGRGECGHALTCAPGACACAFVWQGYGIPPFGNKIDVLPLAKILSSSLWQGYGLPLRESYSPSPRDLS